MEAMEELAQLSESIRQAASLLADDDPSDDSAPRRPSTFLNAVVLGNVGAGKSAVLNSLIGHPVLPTGENGATRAPIVVDLQREPGLSTKTIMLQIDSKSQQVSSSGLRRSLQEKLSKAAIGRGRTEEISLRMRTSTAPSLKLIDLPGLDQRVVDDSMINDYAGHNDAILLVVIPAAQAAEVASSPALRLARDIDSDGSRTIGVLSKVDQAAGDEKTIACVQALLSNKGPKNLPDIEWVALIGQSVAIASAQSGSVVSENSLEAAWQAEAESLKSILTRAPSSKLGRISLVDTIAKRIRKRMKVHVPNLLTGGDMKAKARSLSVKRGGVEKSTKRPKRPINGYFFFMEGYRKDYKEMHPHVKKLATISRAGSKVWKSMTKAEKAPYKAKAEKLSIEYTKKMDAYKKSQPPCVTEAKKRKATYTNKSKLERDEEDDSGNSSLSAKKSKVEKGPKEPKRPVNNFFLFIEDFKNDYKEKYPDTQRECNLHKVGAKVWKSLPADVKAPYTAEAKKLMDEYKKIRAYNNQQEAQRRPATPDKSKSKSDMQAGGREVPGGSDKTLDKSKSKSDMEAGGREVPGGSDKTLDKSKSKSDLQAGGREVPGVSDKSESESDLDTGGSEASGGSDKYKSESLQAGGPEAPGGSDKSKPKSDFKGGGLEAPGGSDKSKPKSDLKGGGPEAPSGSDKSKPKSDLKGGGLEAPGGSDKSKPKSDLKGGGLEAPGNSKAENDNEDHDSGANSGNSKLESVRPLHPKEATVLGGNEGKPRRQRFPGCRLFCGLKRMGRSMKPRASSRSMISL